MFATLLNKIVTKERVWRRSFTGDINDPKARRRMRIHYIWMDHGILRGFWHNFHRIDDGVYRANQPAPRRLDYYKNLGIRTIINLRGESQFGHFLFEQEACENLDLKLTSHRFRATKLPPRDVILQLEESFEQAKKPFLMHCKSGADRAGFAAALYLMMIKGASVEAARKQLSWRYLHLKISSTGILDFFFDAYQKANETSGISMHDWVAGEYDDQAMTAKFHAAKNKG